MAAHLRLIDATEQAAIDRTRKEVYVGYHELESLLHGDASLQGDAGAFRTQSPRGHTPRGATERPAGSSGVGAGDASDGMPTSVSLKHWFVTVWMTIWKSFGQKRTDNWSKIWSNIW
mgnify:CR=1 FL=1